MWELSSAPLRLRAILRKSFAFTPSSLPFGTQHPTRIRRPHRFSGNHCDHTCEPPFYRPAKQFYTCRAGMVTVSSNPPLSLCRERVVSIQPHEELAACVFPDQTKLLLSRFVAKFVAVGDEITFAIPEPDAVGPEFLVTKNSASGPSRYIYRAPIGYVSQPKQDKRNQYFVSAEVQQGSLGISTIFLPCEVLREYFFRLPRTNERADHPTLYDILRIPAGASLSELRVAFKLRDLELKTSGSSRSQRTQLERAFNIVGQPELRACYDMLLAEPE